MEIDMMAVVKCLFSNVNIPINNIFRKGSAILNCLTFFWIVYIVINVNIIFLQLFTNSIPTKLAFISRFDLIVIVAAIETIP